MRLCPKCGSDSEVVNSRPRGDTIWRRRRCLLCLDRWSTLELHEPIALAQQAHITEVDGRQIEATIAALQRFLLSASKPPPDPALTEGEGAGE